MFYRATINSRPFSFEYLTPRVRITPKDLLHTKLDKPSILHFICSPARANKIMADVREQPDWMPTTIYEPIPVRLTRLCPFMSLSIVGNKFRCVPEELPALVEVLPSISILRFVVTSLRLLWHRH